MGGVLWNAMWVYFMLLELTHVFLFAMCCTLALLLTFRLPFPSPITLLSLRIGLILVLADDLIGSAAEFGIAMADSWASAAGAIGAVLICLGLFLIKHNESIIPVQSAGHTEIG